jgi:hypothetical protein
MFCFKRPRSKTLSGIGKSSDEEEEDSSPLLTSSRAPEQQQHVQPQNNNDTIRLLDLQSSNRRTMTTTTATATTTTTSAAVTTTATTTVTTNDSILRNERKENPVSKEERQLTFNNNNNNNNNNKEGVAPHNNNNNNNNNNNSSRLSLNGQISVPNNEIGNGTLSNNHNNNAQNDSNHYFQWRRRIAVHKRYKSVDSNTDNIISTTASTVVVANNNNNDNNSRARGIGPFVNPIQNNIIRATSTSDLTQFAQEQSRIKAKGTSYQLIPPTLSPPKSIQLASFSPPDPYEDLADETEDEIETLSTSYTPEKASKMSSNDTAVDINSGKKQEKLNFSKHPVEQVLQRHNSAGALKIQFENITTNAAKEKMRQISVFVPHKSHGVHRIKLLVSPNVYLRSLVKEAIQKYTQDTKMQPINNSPSGYVLHAAEESGSIDYDYPKIDSSLDSITLAKLPISRFVIVPIDNYLSQNKLFYDYHEMRQRNLLQDIRIRVSLLFENVERVFWQDFAPDMMIRDIDKFLKRKLLAGVVKCDETATAQENGEKNKEQETEDNNAKREKSEADQYIIDIQLGDGSSSRTIITKVIGRRSIKELRQNVTIYANMYRNDQNDDSKDLLLAKANDLARQKKEKDIRFYLPRFLPIEYREYSVIKINKYGRRQERIFAIDGKKVYNKLPYNHAAYNFLGLPAKTRKPERPIETLLNVITNPAKPLSFITVFDDETLYWEAGTVVEKNEIVNTLRSLLSYCKKEGEIPNESNEGTNPAIANHYAQFENQNTHVRVLRQVSPDGGAI